MSATSAYLNQPRSLDEVLALRDEIAQLEARRDHVMNEIGTAIGAGPDVMTAPPPAIGRRALFHCALAAAAGVAIAATTSSPAAEAMPADPVLALIAQENHFRLLGIDARERAEARLRDDEAASADADVVATEGRADDLFARIAETKPRTIAGAIALLDLSGVSYGNELAQMAIDGLRALARGAAQ